MTYDIVCSETQSEKAIQHLGVLILLWRRHYHITQQELAKRTGLLQSYISGLEKGAGCSLFGSEDSVWLFVVLEPMSSFMGLICVISMAFGRSITERSTSPRRLRFARKARLDGYTIQLRI